MSILSDKDIKRRATNGTLGIDPFEPGNVEPASVDLRLSDSFARPKTTYPDVLDTSSDDSSKFYYDFTADNVVLERGDALLASTVETITLPPNLCATVVGRSSLGRLFVSVHETAGFCDPGFSGQITLEMVNNNPNPVRINAGDRICQIVFQQLTTSAEKPYGHEKSQYQNQSGATAPGMDFS